MIRVLVLPDRKEFVFRESRLKLKEILERLGIDDPDSVAVVINGHLVDDPEYVVESGEVKIIVQGIGG
ncbi:MAG: thiamine biosynthesis protein ThiS [Crenarchaeota archaeon]|nr:thiamine biosynthesis protein ThiS [Thermoproteota archaeon]